jgi:WD40 repeat protein/serine/threonine protein kinase
MTPTQWQRVKELFLEAVALPPEGREAFVNEHCADDPEAMAELNAMLAAHLSAPATGDVATVPPSSVHAATDLIGPYKLLQQIGEGGMGVVYMAEQERPVRRRVALKIIKPGMDSAQVIARFEAERQALAMMDHPNIARVYDAGTTDSGRPYFVMELVQGVPITDYCDQKHLTPHERLELFVPVCQAIQHAHQKGVIHRDLKPTNVLVMISDGKPVPKVIDFGVAKALHQKLTEKTLFTQFGNVVGTLEYMSPEQTDLDLMGTDTRSDIYSLGVMLYELLAGSTPLDGKMLREIGYAQMLKTIREVEPPRPSMRVDSSGDALASVAALRHTEPRKLARLLSGDLDWIVMKCLEKDRSQRYETANALAMDIQRHLECEPVLAGPHSGIYRVQKFVRRHRIGVMAGGAVLTALVVGLALATAGFLRAERERVQTQIQRNRADTARIEAQAQGKIAENQRQLAVQNAKKATENAKKADENARDAKLQLANGLVSQADLLNLATRFSEARNLYLDAYNKLVDLKQPLTSVETGLWSLERQTARPLISLTGHTQSVNSVAIAPDGRTALSGSGDQTLKLWELASGKELRTFTGHTGRVSSVAITPDGQTALSGSVDKTLKLWDLASGKEIRTLTGHTQSVNSVAIAPDGRTALSGSQDGTLKLWDLASGKEIRTFSGHTGGVLSVAVAPDGRTALTGSVDKTLKLWDLESGKEVRTFTGAAPMLSVAIAPDGRTALSGSVDNALKLWDLATGKELRSCACHTAGVYSIAIAPDGRTALSGSLDRTLKLWDMASGMELRTLIGHTQTVSSVAFAPDGRTALSGSWDNNIYLWDLAGGKELRTFTGHTQIVSSVAIAPDDRTALSGFQDMTLTLWDLATGKELRTFTGHTQIVTSVAFVPDGRTGLSGSYDGTLKLWDLASGKVIRTFSGHTGGVLSVAVAPGGRTALSGSVDKTLKLWDLASGKEIRTFTGHAGPVSSVAVASNGRTALSSGSWDNTLRLWDLASGKEIRKFTVHMGQVHVVALGPDGRTAISGGEDRALTLWDLVSGREIRTFTGHVAEVWCVAIAPDGRTALSASGDRTLKLWDLESGKEIRTFTGHSQRVFGVALASDGRTALSGSLDRTLKLWDFARGTAHRDFEPRVAAAQAKLRQTPGDPAALQTLGEWYAFCGMDQWAVELLARAREGGAAVAPLTLARSYWNLNRNEETRREFQTALEQSRDAAERTYLGWCMSALSMPLSRADDAWSGAQVTTTDLLKGETAYDRSLPALALAAANTPEGCHVAFVQREVGKGMLVRRDGERGKTYDDVGQPLFSPSGSSLAYDVRLGDRRLVVINDREEQAFAEVIPGSFVFSHDGKRHGYLAIQTGTVVAVIDGKPQPEAAGDRDYEPCDAPVFSANGRSAAYLEASSPPHRKMRAIVNGEPSPPYDGIARNSLLFSPDGSRCSFSAIDRAKAFRVTDGNGGRAFDETGTDFVFSPDGKRTAYAAKDGGNWFLVVDGEVQRQIEGIVPHTLTFSPDSKRLAYAVAKADHTCYIVVDGKAGPVYDSIGAGPPPRFRFWQGPIGVVFSPDSRRLAYLAAQGGKKFLVVDGRPEEIGIDLLWAEPSGDGAIYFSSDSSRFAYGGVRAKRFFFVVDGNLSREYDNLRHFEFSQDGTHFAFAAAKGNRFVITVDGVERAEYGAVVAGPVFRPDGILEFLAADEKSLWRVEVKNLPRLPALPLTSQEVETDTSHLSKIDVHQWQVMCWENKRWKLYPADKMTLTEGPDAIRVENTTDGNWLATFAHTVHSFDGDFSAVVEVKGGHFVSLISSDGADRTVFCDCPSDASWHVFNVQRRGKRIGCFVDGRPAPFRLNNATDVAFAGYICVQIEKGHAAEIRRFEAHAIPQASGSLTPSDGAHSGLTKGTGDTPRPTPAATRPDQTSSVVAAGQTVGNYGASDRVAFRGCQEISQGDVRWTILHDPEVVVASTPSSPLDQYLSVLGRKTKVAYMANGFPVAAASAQIEGGKILVQITEGPRYRCGLVQVSGDDAVAAAQLIARLTREKPRGTFAYWNGERGTIQIGLDRSQAEENPTWAVGKWAGFDRVSEQSLRNKVQTALTELGFAEAKFDVRYTFENQQAVLRVTILDAGEKTTFSKIEVLGLKNSRREDFVKLIGLSEGQAGGIDQLLAAQQRLWDSGRFQKHLVAVEPGLSTRSKWSVRFTVEELAGMPPLDQPLKAEDQAMLKFRNRLLQQIQQGDDLVASASWPAAFDIRLVFGRGGGLMRAKVDGKLWASLGAADSPSTEYAMAVEAHSMRMYGISDSQKLIVRRRKPMGGNVVLVGKANTDNTGRKWSFNLGFGARNDTTGIDLQVDIPPAELIDTLHSPAVKMQIADGVLTATGQGLRLRIEISTGRLLECRWDTANGSGEIALRHGTLEEELAKLERDDPGRDFYNPAHPVSSFAAFLTDETLRGPWVRALGKAPMSPELSSAIRKLLGPSVFEPLDRDLSWLDESDSDFGLPRDSDKSNPVDFLLHILPMDDSLFEQGSWPWTLAREELLIATGRIQTLQAELDRVLNSNQTGPLGHLMAAYVVRPYAPRVTEVVARRGLAFLEPADFHKDVHALVEGDGVAAQVLCRIADQLRHLPRQDVDVLCNSMSPPQAALLRKFRTSLMERGDQRIEQALPAVLDQFWSDQLSGPIEAALRSLAPIPASVP